MMGLNDGLHNRQSETAAVVFCGSVLWCAEESFKDPRNVFFCDSKTFVFEADLDLFGCGKGNLEARARR